MAQLALADKLLAVTAVTMLGQLLAREINLEIIKIILNKLKALMLTCKTEALH